MELSLKDKKIAVLGMGVNNRHLAEFLTRQGIDFEVIENWKDPSELVGKLDKFDVVFRTPGLPFLSEAIQQALKKGVEISSQTKLFFKLCPAPIIGVTGTKGKGTTSSLIAKILEKAGKKVWLGGNIGKDPFEFLEQIKPEDMVVLELSSFQLQDLDSSPHIAVVLNITSDHLNYHRSVEEYIKAKSSILAFQKKEDVAIVGPDVPDWFKKLGTGEKIFFDPKSAESFQTKLLGRHQLKNIAAAAAVAKVLNIDEQTIRKAVSEFEALDHRLKLIRNVDGINYIDDSYSTNIDPAIAAINAFNNNLILVVGGYDKGVDFTLLGEEIKKSPHLKAVVVFGQVTDKILKSMDGFKGKVLTGAKSMDEIISQAKSLAQPGDTVLFSPATSSFDLFKNETDRGEQFVKKVMSL
jgi:UDP-N-acetylmuramoylalanine--D-glutamate ligase